MPSMPRQTDPAPSRDAALLQGTLDLLILRIVALEPLHGYGIVRRIEQMSGEALQIRQGSLYPALYRMEQRGLLTADWKTNDSGKEAKYYRLTKAGRKALDMLEIGRPELDWVALAKGQGVPGVRVKNLDELARELSVALREQGPKLIEIAL